MAIMNVRTGGNLPPTPVPATTVPVKPGATASPVKVMDWRGRLAQGDENAQTRTVQANETVASQLNALTASNSPYLQQAADRARNEASARGMMFSTMAAGAGSRAAIDAALPIASQDATTYGRTASENMAAVNQDRLADQNMWGTLTGQEVGIRANLDESERARGFTQGENALQRTWQTGERLGGQQWQTGERLGTQQWQTGENTAQRSWQTGERVAGQQFTTSERASTQYFQQNMQKMQNAWQGAQNNSQRIHEMEVLEQQEAHDAAMRALDRTFQGSQQDKQLLQQRFLQFEQSMSNQNAMLSQTIASIYNNPNLTAAQQGAAVTNARAVYQSLFTSYAQSLAGGMPQIFYNPYPMPLNATQTTNTPPQPVVPPTTNTTGGGLYGGRGVGRFATIGGNALNTIMGGSSRK